MHLSKTDEILKGFCVGAHWRPVIVGGRRWKLAREGIPPSHDLKIGPEMTAFSRTVVAATVATTRPARTENRAAAGHSSRRRAEAPSPPVRLLVPGEPGEVDVFFYRSMKAARIGPHDVGPSHCVHGEPHVIAEESCLDWIVRDDEIGHRRRRDAVVTDCCRAGGWTLDGRQRDVVAATGLAVAI